MGGVRSAPVSFLQRISDEVMRAAAASVAPGLYLVSTPIGNLGDITIRALVCLDTADVIYAEDTRHSRKLLAHFGIQTKLDSYHDHNADRERPKILKQLSQGQAVALICDAGTPLVSDPGYKLVRDCLKHGHRVFSIPGASSVLAGLTCSGLPTDTFFFAGFLPSKSGARKARIAELAAVPGSLIFFESPSRLVEVLSDLSERLGDRPAVIARELTKLNEDVLRGSLSELAQRLPGVVLKGECVVVVGAALAVSYSDEDIIARLAVFDDTTSVRDASRMIAEELGVSRSRVYDLALKRKHRESP